MVIFEKRKLGEFLRGNRGVSYKPYHLKSSASKDDVVLLRSNNIQNGKLVFDDIQIIPRSIVNENQLLVKGDIVVCMSNGSRDLVGKNAVFKINTDNKFTVGAFCSILKPDQNIDIDFASYLCNGNNWQQHIDLALAGSAINNLKNSQIESIKVDVPPLPIQRKIARILSAIDGQIEKTEAIIAKYQAIKQGMLQDLFTRGIDVSTGQLRPRYEDAPELYKESALGMIPMEWEVVSVQELSLEIKVGIVIKPTQYYKPEGVPMLRSFNVKAGYITMTDLVFMSEKDNNLQAKSRLFIGDVVSVRTGYPGTTAVVTPDVAGCNCIDIVITKVNPARLMAEFLADWTNSTFGMKQIFAKQGGNAQQHFNVGEMKKLRIPNISFHEQQMMVKITHNIHEMISKEVSTLSKLQLLKQGLMQDLLSGRVEVDA